MVPYYWTCTEKYSVSNKYLQKPHTNQIYLSQVVKSNTFFFAM